jgi:hypothetical protein
MWASKVRSWWLTALFMAVPIMNPYKTCLSQKFWTSEPVFWLVSKFIWLSYRCRQMKSHMCINYMHFCKEEERSSRIKSNWK